MREKKINKSVWKMLYDDLMGGLNAMIPVVSGGGILMAVSFMLGMGSDGQSSNFWASTFYEIGSKNTMVLVNPVLAGFMANTIAGPLALPAGMVGGMIASNTGSGFFGAIFAGLLSGYLVKLLNKIFRGFPEKLESLKRLLIFPIISVGIVGFIMLVVVSKPIGMFNLGLTNLINSIGTSNLILTGCVLGGMMAVDLGGPINKVAYTFAVAAISEGNFYPMAAVMAGGVVPPLAVALSTTLFKKKFTQEQKDQGKSCYLLGASFITASCIPIAFSDPFRIIPAGIIGSAVSGALTMSFKIALPAPHGGLFATPIIDGNISDKLLFILSIIIGVVIAAIVMGILRKPVVKMDIKEYNEVCAD